MGFLISNISFGQNQSLTLQNYDTRVLDKSVASVDSTQLTGFKPYLKSYWNTDSVFGYFDEKKYYYAFGRKFLRDDLVEIKGKDFRLTLNPIWDLQLGRDFADTTNFQDSVQIFNNTRGFIITADIGKVVSFETSVFENQSRFPLAYQGLVDSLQVVPGQGRVKVSQETGWDYNSATSRLTVTPLKGLHLQIGHGKHFIGHGYRSMLLSDNAFNYPFIGGEYNFLQDKMKYHWLYANLQLLQRLPIGEVPESLFQRKGASFYYFAYSPHPRVEISLFEGFIWNEWNDSTGTQAFNPKTLIPLLGVNSLLHANDTVNHGFLGINGQVKVLDQFHLYGQALLDVNSTSSQNQTPIAYQIGTKLYDLGIENLDLQLEFNLASDDTYAGLNSQEDYFHLNQSLAHPLGSSFQEWVGILGYRYKRLFGQGQVNIQKQARIGEIQIDRESLIIDAHLGLHLNPKTNMNLSLGWRYRDVNTRFDHQKTQWIYLAFRTSLFNKYWDY